MCSVKIVWIAFLVLLTPVVAADDLASEQPVLPEEEYDL